MDEDEGGRNLNIDRRIFYARTSDKGSKIKSKEEEGEKKEIER